MTEPTVEPDDLAALLAGIGREHGIPPADSALLADTLVMAELWGHPSHGAIRLPWYLARIGTGAMAAVTEVETVRDAGPVVVLDDVHELTAAMRGVAARGPGGPRVSG